MYRLAIKLGKTIREIEDGTSRTDILEWVAFYNLTRFDEEIHEIRFRLLRSQIFYGFEMLGYVFGKVMTGNGTKPKPPKLDQFRSINLSGESEESRQIQKREEFKAFIMSVGGKESK